MFPKLPEEIVKYLFILHRGQESKRYCEHCDKATDQIALSYSEIAMFRVSPVTKAIGRILDVTPGITFLGGAPHLCECHHVNF